MGGLFPGGCYIHVNIKMKHENIDWSYQTNFCRASAFASASFRSASCSTVGHSTGTLSGGTPSMLRRCWYYKRFGSVFFKRTSRKSQFWKGFCWLETVRDRVILSPFPSCFHWCPLFGVTVGSSRRPYSGLARRLPPWDVVHPPRPMRHPVEVSLVAFGLGDLLPGAGRVRLTDVIWYRKSNEAASTGSV